MVDRTVLSHRLSPDLSRAFRLCGRGVGGRRGRQTDPRPAAADGARSCRQEETGHHEGHRHRRLAWPHVMDRSLRPGRMYDATAARNEGIAVCFQRFPDVEVLLDDGCLGLSRDHRGQAITPPRKRRPGALPGRLHQWERDRHGHSSDRSTVEHALAEHKRRKRLTRWTHRRDRLPVTYRAIAGLVHDRSPSLHDTRGSSSHHDQPGLLLRTANRAHGGKIGVALPPGKSQRVAAT